jgi:internalin A
VRAHFRDIANGAATATDAKLIVLGNGRVGKTQICRRLRNEPYDDTQPSTHGIQVTSAELDTGDAESTRLNIWDFGGQDLYHGTHALFLRTSAIFLLVWAREMENEQGHTDQGITFRNQRLPYWLAFVRHLGASDSPVLVVQTRCDRVQDEALAPPIPDDAERPEHCVVLHYSALNDRGRDELDRRLREAVASLREHQGVAQIGIGRLKVQRALQDMRDADAKVPPAQRQYRTVTPAHFQALCDEAGNVSSPGYLLQYLHNAGIVFHRPGLFRDSIVLDQGWALDAIYAVFNREKCYRELKRLRGRFTRPLLELLVWGDHTEPEQRLFLDMMLSCGVCFVHREAPHGERDDDTEYIAPDLLPERAAVQAELDGRWDAALPTETVSLGYAMLHPGLVRGLICEIGGAAGVDALYWRGGVCVYETHTRSHALIEQTMTDGWHGRLTVQTQGGQAAALRDQLADWIEQRNNRDGLRATRIGPAAAPAAAAARMIAAEAGLAAPTATDAPPGRFGPAPAEATEYFVSYAWGDATPQGQQREAIVDRLCAAAEARGTRIIRDKTALRTGDRISAFMRRIGRGDRVFVILSDKYLRSAFCMFELCEIWFHSRRDEADFLRRVRVYALPDAEAATPLQRARLAAWWKTQHDEIAALIKEHGAGILATEDFQRFKDMEMFCHHVPGILATLFDTVQPRSFEALEQYGFDDSPTA